MTDGSSGCLVSLAVLALLAAGFAASRRRPALRIPLPRRPLPRLLAALSVLAFVAVGSVKPGSPPDRFVQGAFHRLESLVLSNSFPFGRATWPFDAPTAGVVSNLAATGESAIPDAMFGSGFALWSVAEEPAAGGPAPGSAVPHWLSFDADNRCVSAALPFAFPFGDASFDRVDILSNGRLSFGDTTFSRRSASGFPPPAPEDTGACVLAPAWGDTVLATRNGAAVLVDARTNAFTVTWRNALNPSAPWATNTAFSCTLLPTGDAEWRYTLPEPAFATNLAAGVQSGTNAWALFDGDAPQWLRAATNGAVVARLSRVGADWFFGDADGDGLGNGEEFLLGTDPYRADTDGDGVPDVWEVRMGTNPDAITTSWPCADADGDGFTDEYERLFLDSDPHDATSPQIPDADEAAVLYCWIGSDRPCWLVLLYDDDTNRTEEVRVAWPPGISPDCVGLVVEAARPASVSLERAETGGYWRCSLELDGAGAFSLNKTSLSDSGWIAPGATVGEGWSADLWRLGSPAEPFDFCHALGHAEIWLTSLAHYGGTVAWSSVPQGISGTGNPLVFSPSEVEPGTYDVTVSARATTGTAEGHYTVHIRTLRLLHENMVCDADGTSTRRLPVDDVNSFIPAGESYYVTSEPKGIDSLEFVPAELEAGRKYAVDVWNGDCGYATVTVVTAKVECRPTATWPDYPRSDLGVGELLSCTVSPGDVSVSWSCTDGRATIDNASSANTTLRVLDVPGALTVTASIGGQSVSTNFVVHEPEEVAYSTILIDKKYGYGVIAAGGTVIAAISPKNVSFDNITIMEEVCDVTWATGWFDDDERKWHYKHTPKAGAQNPIKPQYKNFYNAFCFEDVIEIDTDSQRPSQGTLYWQIPAYWWVDGQGIEKKHPFGIGFFSMSASVDDEETATVGKYGSSIKRFVSGTTILTDSNGETR